MSKLTISELNGIAGSLNQVDVSSGHTLELEGNLRFDSTGSHVLPSGTTAQRPASAPVGAMRFNTSSNEFEIALHTSFT